MTEHEYRTHPALSRSELWKMSESPEKFKWYRDHPQEPTESLLFGRVVHKLVLEPDDYASEFLTFPNLNLRTSVGKAALAQYEEEAQGRQIVTMDKYLQALSMAEVVRAVPFVAECLRDGQTEQSFFWTDSLTEVDCKCRTDIYVPSQNIIVDYKTTSSAETRQFNRSFFKYGYHLQAAMYSLGVRTALELDELPEFYFVAQEKAEPYSVNIVRVTDDVMTYGMDVFRELIGTYKVCSELDSWPGYLGFDGDIAETVLPGWVDTVESEED